MPNRPGQVKRGGAGMYLDRRDQLCKGYLAKKCSPSHAQATSTPTRPVRVRMT